MDWVPVARWIKGAGSEAEIRKAAENIRKHWEEVALDEGYDPKENVTMMEGAKEIRVAISEAMDTTFREGPGAWRYY